MLSAAQRQILRTELTSDPLSRGYAAMSHDAAADRVNVKDRSVVRRIDKRKLLRWGVTNDRMTKVRSEADSGTNGKRSIAYAALKSLDIPGDYVTIDDEFLSMFDALVTGNVLSASDKTALIEAATETVSRVDELCGQGAIADNQDVYVCRVEMGG